MAGSVLMPLLTLLKGKERILVALALFVYLTAAQITKLLYAPSSYSHVRKEVNDWLPKILCLLSPAAMPTCRHCIP